MQFFARDFFSRRRFEGAKLPTRVLLRRIWQYMGRSRFLLILALLLSLSSSLLALYGPKLSGHALDAINLKDGVELHIERDGVLLGSREVNDFPEIVTNFWRTEYAPRFNKRCFIYAEGCTDIAITGRGVIDCQGEAYVEPMTEEEIDASFDLPYTRLPHPKYKGKIIPAFEMIKFSINTHRGCFGGCNFCTIAAHQGKFIQSRSEESILKEIKALNGLPGFAGNISDVGAPTANMYGMKGKNPELCAKCRRKSCLFPSPCKNMDRSHQRLLDLYAEIARIKGIRHAYIGSGIRYDLFLDEKGFVDETSYPYLKELILEHTSGRLKVAPEHTEDSVLKLMAKPSFNLFERLRIEFDRIVASSGRKCELVPYFISGHPGCGMREMQKLARKPALQGLYMDQVQDFTPTPMTTSSVMYYTGLDPKNLEKVFVERDIERKKEQKSFFFRRGKK